MTDPIVPVPHAEPLVALRQTAEAFLRGFQAQSALDSAMHQARRAGYPAAALQGACEAALDHVLATLKVHRTTDGASAPRALLPAAFIVQNDDGQLLGAYTSKQGADAFIRASVADIVDEGTLEDSAEWILTRDSYAVIELPLHPA